MKKKLVLWALAGTLGLAAAPSMAVAAGSGVVLAQAYQNADGSYPSYTAFSRDLNGVPCGIECSHNLAALRRAAGPSRYFALQHRREW